MNPHRSLTLAKRTLLTPVILFAFLLMAKVTGAESEITFQSPDGKFGVRNFEDGRVELIARHRRKRTGTTAA